MTDDQIREATSWVVAACDRRFAGDRGPLERRLAYPGEMAKLLRTLERDPIMRAAQRRHEVDPIPDAVWALIDLLNGMPTLERERTMGKVAREYWRYHRKPAATSEEPTPV